MIGFYAGFSPALEVQKSVIFFTLLLNFSQITKRTGTRYILSMVLLVTGMRGIVKGIVAYLKLQSHACM